jgi:peptidoglycan-associated lipoprotein
MSRKLAVIVFAALSATACAHQKPVVAGAPPPPPTPAVAELAVPAAPTRASCSTDLQCTQDQLCVSGACTAITPSLSACGLTRVHFDLDQDVIHPDEFPSLQRMARCIQANQPAHVLITGNADERGTVEYNLALGQRRAGAVSKYLRDLGVSGQRLELVSYGKELPLCAEHDEACWQQNRRAGVHPGGAARDIAEKINVDERRERTATVK